MAVIVCCAAWLSFSKDGAGAELIATDQTGNATTPIVYRRIYVPANDPKSWPLEHEKYLPIEAKDFEALVTGNSAATSKSSAPSLDLAEYTARLDDDGVLRGHGQWTVNTKPGDSLFVPIPQFSLTVTNARWTGSKDQPVQLGMWGHDHAAPSEWGLVIPRPGTLDFYWEVRPQIQSDGVECAWHVPSATINRITFDLPDGQEPSLNGGVVLGTTQTDTDSHKNAGAIRQWKIAFSALGNSTLKIASIASKKRKSRDQASVREITEYRIQERGLDIHLSWEVSLATAQQQELSIPLPNGVQVASVLLDGQEANWHLERGDKRSADKAAISLAPTQDQRSIRIEVAAWQPLTLNESWQLPALHADGVLWCAGRFDLQISPEIELRSLAPVDCGQDSIKTSKIDGANWESRAFTAYSSGAALEVTVSNPTTIANVRTASSLALADPDVAGKLSSEWEVVQGSLYHLSGDLVAGWNIEAVETTPANALAEWSIDTSNGRRRLEIELTHAATPARRISVQVSGRLQRSKVSEPISAESLRMIRWTKANETQHLLSFQTSDPFVAEPIGSMPIVSRDQLRNNERSVVAPVENDARIVDLTQADDESALKIAVKRGQYTTDIDLDASYSPNEVKQTWRIAARPMSNAIDRLLIYATSPIRDGVKWSEGISHNPVVAERIRDTDPQRKSFPKDGELWLLRLSQPTSKLIELFAVCTANAQNRADIPLLSLPQAVEQHGLITLRSGINDSPIVDVSGLAPVLIPAARESTASVRSISPIRAMFRYSPTECLDPPRTPKLSIGSSGCGNGAAFIVRYLKLESLVRPDGTALHCATYDLLDRGATEFKSPLANDATIDAIFVNDRPVSMGTSSEKDHSLPVRIPLDARESVVKIYFETHQSPLRPFCTIEPPHLRSDAPVLESEWNAWLPEGYAVADDRNHGFRWQERLFGPLLRSKVSSPFDPLRMFDWQMPDVTTGSPGVAIPRQPAAADDISGDRTSSESASDAKSDTQNARAADRSALLNKYESTLSQAGWHMSHQSFAADDVPRPRFVSRPNTIHSWALGILVACYLLGRRYCVGRVGLTIAAITAAGSFALGVPGSVAPLATGALWGFMACAIVNYWKRVVARPSTPSIPASSSVVASCCLFLCFFLSVEDSRAETSSPAISQNSAGESSTVERLLIPIDADKNPVDTKYYISERFIHELLQPKSASVMSERKWLLRDATYVGDLTQTHGKSEIASGNWSLAFSVETLARNTTIQIPLVEKEAVWQGAAMLDGVPVPVEWCSDGQGCKIEVAQPGRYTLTLFCAPIPDSKNGASRVKLSIPAIASAKVHIHTSGQPSDVKVSGATLVSPKKEEQGVSTFELGDLDQLSVDWVSAEQKSTTPSQAFNVSEMNWLHVGTEQTELETKYIVDGNGQLPESVLIQYDARWIPLSENRNDAKAGEDSNDATQPRTLKARLIAADNDRHEANVRWKLNESLSAGILPIPRISLVNPPASQRWLAVSSDPKLDCTLNDNDTAVATPKEFLAKWGTSSQTPQPAAVVANFDADRMWTVAIRPHEAESAIREVLHIAAGLPQTRVIYQANVSPRGVDQFGLRLSIPPQMEIDDVLLTEGDRQIEIRWAKDDENHVNVFFAEAARNDYRLTLSGRVATVANIPLGVPRVTAMQAATTQVQIYRDDEVDTNLKGFPGTDKTNSESIELPPIQWLVRSLGTYRLDDAASRTAQLIIAPHRAELTGDNVTTITREGGSWWITYRAHITPKTNLDVYRAHFPASCLVPFDVQASLPVTTETTASDGGQTLALRFNSSVTQGTAVDLRIRSQLATSASAPFAVPNVTEPEPCIGHRYIDVPAETDNGPFEWTTAGVHPAQLPSEFSADSTSPTKRAQFQIAKDEWHVAAAPATTNAPQPRIPLVDTSLVVGESSGQIGHSQFVLVPGGASDCILELPPGEQLLSAELDGHLALLSPTEGARWRISLDSQRLPQILEVAWNSSSGDGADEKSDVRRPILLSSVGPIPVEMSLWSVVHPTGPHRLSVEGASAVSSLDQAVLRLDRLVRTAESASSVAAEAQPDGANWFHTWAATLQTARNDVQALVKTPSTATSVAELTPSSSEQVRQISSRLDKWLEASTDLFGNVDSSSSEPSTAVAAHSIAPIAGKSDRETTRYIGEGDADRLVLTTTDVSTASRRLQLVAVVAAICLGIAVNFLWRLPAIRDAAHRYPHALGVIFGILYWAWLWPSWLGMLIVAASAGLAVRFSWPGRSIRPESSTVLRSTRTF